MDVWRTVLHYPENVQLGADEDRSEGRSVWMGGDTWESTAGVEALKPGLGVGFSWRSIYEDLVMD